MKYPTVDSDYYRKYGMTRDPFPLHSIDSVLFLTPEHKHRFDLIKDQIMNSRNLVVVISPPGAGKTFMSHNMDSIKEPDWKINLVKANAGMDVNTLADAFVQQIIPEKMGENINVLSQLHKSLELFTRKKITLIMVIDDAHKLPVKTLKFVLQLAALRYGEAMFRFVLFANETINDLLDNSKLEEQTADEVQRIYIPSFSEIQTKEYINKRLSLCGLKDKVILTDDDISHIHEISGGLPRGINLLTRSAMQDVGSGKVSETQYGRSAITLGIILVLTVTAYSLIFGKHKTGEIADTDISMELPGSQSTSPTDQKLPERIIAQVQSSESETPVSQVQPVVQMVEESELEMEVQISGDDLLTLETPVNTVEDDAVEIETVYVVEDSIEEATVDTEVPVESDGVAESETVYVVEDSIEVATVITEVPVESDGMAESESVYVVEDSFQESVAATEVPVESDSVIVSEDVSMMTESDEEEQATIEVLPEMQDETASPVSEQQESGPVCNEVNIYHLDEIPDFIACVNGPDWFHKQSSRSYALQLTSSRDVGSVQKLLQGQDVNPDLLSGYTNYTPSGKPRYLLYYGIYPDRAAAKAAVQTLPEKIRAVGPWPRTVSDIVTELNNLAARGY
jgi:type II secretory pathway predicted ATPase ExeA